MGLVPFKHFDITTEEGREAERQYLRKRIKDQQIMSCIVFGSVLFFFVFMMIVLAYKWGH